MKELKRRLTQLTKQEDDPYYNLREVSNYYCEKCQGTTKDSKTCENPECPNQPCCGKPKIECDCRSVPESGCPICGAALKSKVSGGVVCTNKKCDYWFCY